MKFVSFAQNFEDVILWRVLKDVLSGFYIDVGANDPVIDSVSYAFYQRGWRGIHVEPMPVYAEKIRAARPIAYRQSHFQQLNGPPFLAKWRERQQAVVETRSFRCRPRRSMWPHVSATNVPRLHASSTLH